MIKELLETMAPGTVMHTQLPVGTMASGAPIALPLTVIKGVRPGACLWVNGQVHGGEVNGVIAAVELGRRVDPATMSGSIVITPTANPLAFDNHSKTAPQDLADLDQSFPGGVKGTVTGHMAHALFKEVREVASCLVNLHTMGAIHTSEPYCVYKVWPGGKVQEKDLLRMTSYFAPSVACRMDVGGAGELPGNIAGALDYQCLANDIPAFMVELGQGSWYTPANVELAVRGLTSLGQEFGILQGQAVAGTAVRRVTKRQWVMVREGGLFLSQRNAAETIAANDRIGQVVNLAGAVVEEVSLPMDAIVIGLRRDPVVHTGDRIGFFATQWDMVAIQ